MRPQTGVGRQSVQGVGHRRDVSSWDREAGDTMGDVFGQPAGVRTHHRQPHRLRLGDGHAERLGQRRMDQHVRPGQLLADAVRVERPEQLDVAVQAEVGHCELGWLAVFSVADDPVLELDATLAQDRGRGQRQLMALLPVKPADAQQPQRPVTGSHLDDCTPRRLQSATRPPRR